LSLQFFCQILSQMKRCHDLATDKAGAAGKVLTKIKIIK
jgi:hypothetical protein